MIQKKFKIGDLFYSQTGNVDLKQEHINGRGIPVVSSGLADTGIIGNTDLDARIFPKNTITIDMFGNAFFRDFEYKEVTHARVFTLIPRGFELNTETGLYFVALLHWLPEKFSYNNMCSYAKICDLNISLPVIEYSDPSHVYTPADIDWGYMQERIAELEQERIAELEQERIAELDAYLKATGLDDYELTDEDKETLSLSQVSTSDEAEFFFQ